MRFPFPPHSYRLCFLFFCVTLIAGIISFITLSDSALTQSAPPRKPRTRPSQLPARGATPRLIDIVLNPKNVTAGGNVQCTVSLSLPAPANGVAVAISSSNPNIAPTPANVTIGGGKTNATFNISIAQVTTISSVAIAANFGGVNINAPLNVVPDTTAPIISNIIVNNIAERAATICWVTNEAADSRVEYGITPGFGKSTSIGDRILDHKVDLSGLNPGTLYHFKVRSSDAAGNQSVTGNYTFSTSGSNQPPSVSVAASTTCGLAPLTVHFTSTSSDPEGSTLSYKWSFGDGLEGEGANIAHIYQSSGTFTAKLTVTDEGGVSANTSIIINVNRAGITPPPPQTGGKTYYVAPSGSDFNSGAQSSPFRTIQKASNVVNPGDTVIVRDGVYAWESGLNDCLGKAIVCMPRGGTETNWVVFKSENLWGAKLDGQNIATDGFVFDKNIGYVRVEGFDVFRLLDTGGSPEGGISAQGFNIYSGGHNVQIVGNHIHHISNHCTTDGGTAIYIKRNNVLIEGNLIHDIRNLAFGEQGCTLDNPNHSHGIYLSGNSSNSSERASGAIIRNNIFFGITSGWPIHIYPGTLDNIKIFNNTFADPNPKRSGHIIITRMNLSSSSIQNNIFYQPDTSAFNIGTSQTTFNNVTISHNITTTSALVDNTSLGSGVKIENNRAGVDPQLARPFDQDPSRRDFHLQSGSPAIDTGVSLPDVINDYMGCKRPYGAGFDMGAFEFQGTPSRTASTSQGLRTYLELFKYFSQLRR